MSQRLLKGHHHHSDTDEMEDLLSHSKNSHSRIVGYGSVIREEEEEESDLKIDPSAAAGREDHDEAAAATVLTTSAALSDNNDCDEVSNKKTERHRKRSHRRSDGHLGESGVSARSSLAPTASFNASSRRESASGNQQDDQKEPEGPQCGQRLRRALIWFYSGGRKILVKYWIWIVALMLMIMSVSGKKVVVFRIFYMTLFLVFLLTFQVSRHLGLCKLGLWTHFRTDELLFYSKTALISCVASISLPIPHNCHRVLLPSLSCCLHLSISTLSQLLGKVSPGLS